MLGYTKLFHTIVTSTIWQEDAETKVLWVTLLALADKNGEVQGSIPGLAKLAGVTIETAEAALKKFQEPDRYSRSEVAEGRRIEVIPGGWELINHSKYRKMTDLEDKKAVNAARQKRFRDRNASVTLRNASVTLRNAPLRSVTKSNDIAEAEAEAEAVLKTTTPAPTAAPITATPKTTSSQTSRENIKTCRDIIPIPEVLKPYEKQINDWIAYKREKGQSYKPRGLQALYADCIKFGAGLPDAIQNSMAKNYAGIYAGNGSSGFKLKREQTSETKAAIEKAAVEKQREIIAENKRNAHRLLSNGSGSKARSSLEVWPQGSALPDMQTMVSGSKPDTSE